MIKLMVSENTHIERIRDINPESIVLDGLDNAIIGVGISFDLDPRLTYSIDKIIGILMERDNMTYDEATEYYLFNIAGGYFGKHGPIFVE
jgi:hypothetical protein